MEKRTASGEALTELILEIFRFNGALLDAGNKITEPYGLTSARWQVMGAIDLAGRELTVSQIARRMGLSRQNVQRIVNDLVSIGIIETKVNVDHKRAPLISLTQKGSKIIAAINKAQYKWVNELSDGKSERQINQALKLIKEIRSLVE